MSNRTGDVRQRPQNLDATAKVTRRRIFAAGALPFLPSAPSVGPSLALRFAVNGSEYRVDLYSPEAWSSIPERSRPAASPTETPGWMAAMVELGPLPETFAHWRRLASRGALCLDPDGFPIPPWTSKRFDNS